MIQILAAMIILFFIPLIIGFIIDEPFITIISLIVIIIMVILLNYTLLNSNKKQLTKQIDYNIILLQSNQIEITDKHCNKDTIEFDQLEEYIEQDNL